MNTNENTIIVMNHRTRVDWNYMWIGLYHAKQIDYSDCETTSFLDVLAGGKSKTKFVLKDELKAVPGLGKNNFSLCLWIQEVLNTTQSTSHPLSLYILE